MQIETQRLLLRDFTLDDVEALAACRADERLWRYYEPVDDILTNAREHVELFVRRQGDTPRRTFHLAIVLKADSSIVGDVGIRQYPLVSYGKGRELQAYIDYEMDPRYWGNGYATEAARAIVDYGFETLELHRVWAYCLATNEPSWRLMERLGMRREGVLRENSRLRGEWMDTYVYGTLREEWDSSS